MTELTLYRNRKFHMQELTRLTMERRIDTYKALVPDIKWVANPVKAQDVIKARRVQLSRHECIASYVICASRLSAKTAGPTLAYMPITAMHLLQHACCSRPTCRQLAGFSKQSDTLQAAKTAKVEEEREAAKKPMTSWLAGQKLPPVRTIPFRKTKTEAARLAQMGAVLSGFLPPCDSLCITFKDAQEHFALSAKVCGHMLKNVIVVVGWQL